MAKVFGHRAAGTTLAVEQLRKLCVISQVKSDSRRASQENKKKSEGGEYRIIFLAQAESYKKISPRTGEVTKGEDKREI